MHKLQRYILHVHILIDYQQDSQGQSFQLAEIFDICWCPPKYPGVNYTETDATDNLKRNVLSHEMDAYLIPKNGSITNAI